MATISTLLTVWCLAISLRLFHLQLKDVRYYDRLASNQTHKTIKLNPRRGMILDRNGTPLAMSVPAGSVYVHPHQVANKKKVSRQLARVLNLSEQEVANKLHSKKSFVWVKRQAPREEAEAAAGLEVRGVGYFPDSIRRYPYEEAAGVLLGTTGTDGTGLSGLEAKFDKHLRGSEVTAKVSRDGKGTLIAQLASMPLNSEEGNGNDLQLTIDADIQSVVEEELLQGKEDANAVAATAVVLDPVSGEVLAMSQVPQYNFNTQRITNRSMLTNKVIETIYEPGSTMKPLVMAAALEMGITHPRASIDCENGRFAYAKRVIKDDHPAGVISMRDVIVRSSNIGMSKLGIRMGKQRLYGALKAFGFGEDASLGLPGGTNGLLRHVSRWSGIDVATHTFGQGVAVTPLQMVRAVSAIVNGGYLPPLSLIKTQEPGTFRRILSEKTSRHVQDMMVGVVEEPRGTGKRARIPGIRIGGKTGTAQKARTDGVRGYAEGKYVASFVGFVDASGVGIPQKLVMLITIDEPNTTSIYGGALAAPVFRKIARRTLQLLTDREQLRVPLFNSQKARLVATSLS